VAAKSGLLGEGRIGASSFFIDTDEVTAGSSAICPWLDCRANTATPMQVSVSRPARLRNMSLLLREDISNGMRDRGSGRAGVSFFSF
jgi:hypothetical protein